MIGFLILYQVATFFKSEAARERLCDLAENGLWVGLSGYWIAAGDSGGGWLLRADHLGDETSLGNFRVSENLKGRGPKSGQRARFFGFVRCDSGFRNPGVPVRWLSPLGQFWVISEIKLMTQSRGFLTPVFEVRDWVWQKLSVGFSGYSTLRGLVLASYFGEVSGLSDVIHRTMKRSGLLHLLALSGQHVTALRFVFGTLIWLGVWMVPERWFFGRSFAHLLALTWVMSALILWLLCPTSSSVLRATTMVVARYLLWRRGFSVSALQLWGSSVALLILVDPSEVTKTGFLLSASGAFFLAYCPWQQGWKGYLKVSLLMPILFLPLQSHFFASVAWGSVAANLLVAWIWSLVVLPLSFIAPIGLLLPSDLASRLMWSVESGLVWGMEYLELTLSVLSQGFAPIPSLAMWEVLVWEIALLMIFFNLTRCDHNESQSVAILSERV